MAQIGQILRTGCRVWLSPPPFDHSKLLVVDGVWSLIGSANWDTRSLRLNFELSVEAYNEELAAALDRLIDEKIAAAEALTPERLAARRFLAKLRDGTARLFSPYL